MTLGELKKWCAEAGVPDNAVLLFIDEWESPLELSRPYAADGYRYECPQNPAVVCHTTEWLPEQSSWRFVAPAPVVVLQDGEGS